MLGHATIGNIAGVAVLSTSLLSLIALLADDRARPKMAAINSRVDVFLVPLLVISLASILFWVATILGVW